MLNKDVSSAAVSPDLKCIQAELKLSNTHTQPVAPALSGCLVTVGVAWLLGPCGRGGGDAALISS